MIFPLLSATCCKTKLFLSPSPSLPGLERGEFVGFGVAEMQRVHKDLGVLDLQV